MTAIPGRPALLRTINDRAAFELLLVHGPLSRSRLAELTGLAQPTVTQLMGRLQAGGLVVPAGIHAGGRGPNAKLYAANPRTGYVAGVDVTPSRLSVAIADITGEVVAEYEMAGSRSRVRAAIEGAVGQVGLRVADLAHIVLGTPGAIDRHNGALWYAAHMAGWHHENVVDGLRAELGVSVDVENDVNLAAVAEMQTGAARGVESFVVLWAGDGLGMAVVLDGRIRRGANGAAGEVSYLPIADVPLSREIGRGGHGGFQRSAGGDAVLDLARTRGIPGKTAAEAVRNADSGFLAELATRLATGLAAVICVVDPELVVFSGEIPEAGGEALLAFIREELAELAVAQPRLALSALPGNGVRAGALHSALTIARRRLWA
ncbi:MAG: family transcriptional regulator [Amycolatopsis sp.]|uniref:ROK family transcriptional regulator n=1 Tax=Amycolatopsis sp. TaxID=37632 RepID=UPI002615FB9C|nr:ROK family transcriptional regulator [Amycolatopsis sp.]MCU1684346.1 family transcriptional regulator [Amycolatopsis sp.]